MIFHPHPSIIARMRVLFNIEGEQSGVIFAELAHSRKILVMSLLFPLIYLEITMITIKR